MGSKLIFFAKIFYKFCRFYRIHIGITQLGSWKDCDVDLSLIGSKEMIRKTSFEHYKMNPNTLWVLFLACYSILLIRTLFVYFSFIIFSQIVLTTQEIFWAISHFKNNVLQFLLLYLSFSELNSVESTESKEFVILVVLEIIAYYIYLV